MANRFRNEPAHKIIRPPRAVWLELGGSADERDADWSSQTAALPFSIGIVAQTSTA